MNLWEFITIFFAFPEVDPDPDPTKWSRFETLSKTIYEENFKIKNIFVTDLRLVHKQYFYFFVFLSQWPYFSSDFWYYLPYYKATWMALWLIRNKANKACETPLYILNYSVCLGMNVNWGVGYPLKLMSHHK